MATKERSIEDRVRDIIVEALIVDELDVTKHSNLREDLGADSLDLVEIGLQIEEAFHFEVDDADGDAMVTFEDVVALVEKRLKEMKKTEVQ